MTSEAYALEAITPDWNYLALVFCSTILIYSIHRIVGIKRLESYSQEGRFAIISKYRLHIGLYIVLSSIGLGLALTMSDLALIIQLIPVGIISFLYTLPILTQNKRLRDFHYIKIFLIAIVWAYVASLPLLSAPFSALHLGLYFLEKLLFILAITLPFDIRDLEIDGYGDLKTIPSVMGKTATYRLVYLLLGIGSLALGYSYGGLLSIAIYGLTGIAIWASRGKESDYYYSGLLDGTLIMRGVLVWLVYWLL